MRKELNLDGIWEFRFSETESWQKYPTCREYSDFVSVPGCFDVLTEWFGKRGTAFYRRHVKIGGKAALYVDGLGVEGVIFWDGKPIGNCPYAYMPERILFDAGEYKNHELLIAVSNRYNNLVFPYYDFYAFGGIFGSVRVEELPEFYIDQVQIQTLDFQRPEIRVDVKVSRFLRKKRELKFEFDGKIIKREMIGGRQKSFQFVLPGFAPWSPEQPSLHQVVLTLGDDQIMETFGIREIKTEGPRLYLNGKQLILKGFNRHESHPQFGAAMPESLMTADLHLAKSQGCNFIRGSHYPQRKSFLDLCDRMGILIWEETLGWDVKPPYLFSREFLSIEKDQANRLVNRHFNHPSIIIWGFLNETESQLKRTRRIIQELYRTIRKNDTTRLITFASNKYEKDCCMDLVDIVSMNPYPGWYSSDISQIESRMTCLISAVPTDKPLLISEIGAGALYGFHDFYNSRWSEEYQAMLAEEVCRCVLTNSRFCGLVFWLFCDAKSYINSSGRTRGFNNKGFLDEYRRPKLAWKIIDRYFKKDKA